MFFISDTHREKLCFTQFSTRTVAWLLLTFFLCLHNQLTSIISLHVWKMWLIKQTVKMNTCSFEQVLRQIFGQFFFLNTGKRFYLEVSFQTQQKEHRFFEKTVIGTFKIALSLRNRHVFMWQSLKIFNAFTVLTLKQKLW